MDDHDDSFGEELLPWLNKLSTECKKWFVNFETGRNGVTYENKFEKKCDYAISCY